MFRRDLLRGASLGAIILATCSTNVAAQQSLPTLDIGAAQPTAARAKPKPEPVQAATTGGGSSSEASRSESPAGGYGGAGVAQDPYNKTYVLEDASAGTLTNTPVMETPLNVQSVSQQVLRDQQVTDIAHALKNISGIVIAHGAVANGNPFDKLILRGFATENIYRDGFRLDGGAGYGVQQLANVASVEVLKGPGATLYGLSEPGGLVNIVTKQPLDSPYYAVNQQIGSLREYRTSVDATGPLNADKSLLYRMNMSYENNGAPFGSVVDDVHQQSIFLAPVLKWNIDQNTWVKLEGLYNNSNVGSFWPGDPYVNGAFVPIPRNLNYNASSPNNSTSTFVALTWSHDFNEDWSIRQMFAYNRVVQDSINRLGTTVDTLSYPYAAYNPLCCTFDSPVYDRYTAFNIYRNNTLATNVNITGHVDTFGVQHTLLIGGDFYKSSAYSRYALSNTISPVSVFNPVQPGLPFTPPLILNREQTSPQNTAGLFVQDQLKLPYDLYFTGSARYQYIRQNGGIALAPSFSNPSSTVAAGGLQSQATTLQAVTPRFGLLWRPEKWVSAYINYAEGFGANQGWAYPLTPLAPTSARESEVGVKFELLDGKLRASAAYYDLTKTNIAQADNTTGHICPGGACSSAIGEARSKGVEFDVQGTLLPGWNAILAYTNQDVIVTKTYAGDVRNTVGQPLALTPRNIASLQTTYEFQDGLFEGLKLGVGYNYYGAARVDDLTGTNLGPLTPSLPGYGTINLLANYNYYIAGTKFNIGLNIDNLLNRTYYTGASIGAAPFNPSPPFVGYTPGLRVYGAPFSVLGHISAEFPGTPAPHSLSTLPAALSSAFNWTGFYVGGHVGYGWGDNNGTFSYVTPDGFAGSQSLANDAQGVLFGAHGGYNYQINDWVVGLEASVDGANLGKQELLGWNDPTNFSFCPIVFPCNGGSLISNIQTGVQGAVRGRLGYAWDRFLVYGAAGGAVATFNIQSNLTGQYGFFFAPPTLYSAAAADRSVTKLGWTIGGGVEYAINNNWSVRGEYRYTDFGSITETPTSVSDPGAFYLGARHLTQNQILVGFSYRFADPEPEVAPSAPVGVRRPALPVALRGAAPNSSRPSTPVAINWTGFYVGGQAGYAFGANHASYAWATPGGLNGGGPLVGDAQGVTFGAHVGYDQQFGNWVVGVEGAINGTNLSRTNSLTIGDSTNSANSGVLTTFVQSDLQGAILARAGYAFGRLLPYAAAGVALGEFAVQSQSSGADAAGSFFAARGLQSTTRVGWTVGGGLEWAINNNWSIRGEYRFSDFGNIADAPLVSTGGGAAYSGSRHLDQNQVQFGFGYKFGGREAPAL